jgi:hypothetical protein
MQTIILTIAITFAIAITLANADQSSTDAKPQGQLFELRKAEVLHDLFKRKEHLENAIFCVEKAVDKQALQACRQMKNEQ